jgi:hypothetical protein
MGTTVVNQETASDLDIKTVGNNGYQYYYCYSVQ